MRVFCFGIGYSALATVDLLREMGWHISGTTRNPVKQEKLADKNITSVMFGSERKMNEQGMALLHDATHVLISIPPQQGAGDIVFNSYGSLLPKLPNLQWVGYLSSTGVYGDHGGGWVDEKTPAEPTGERSLLRRQIEQQWLSLAPKKVPVHIFRLAGIYGPGRSVIDRLKTERSPIITKEGHFFNRIHVDDIANVITASMTRPRNGGVIYNVADDEPTPSSTVVRYAYDLMGMTPPAPITYESVKDKLPVMTQDFYADNKRVKNTKIKEDLDIILSHPTYREGLRDCLHKSQL